MSRMTITIDDDLLVRAREALGVSTKAEAVRIALAEVIRRKRLEEALSHRGAIDLEVDQETIERQRGTE